MHYDANGNIDRLQRSFQAVDPGTGDYSGMNDLVYDYGHTDGSPRRSNLLRSVSSSVTNPVSGGFQPVPFLQHDYVYTYDKTGNLTRSTYGPQTTVLSWTPYGKVEQAVQTNGSESQTTTFGYGPDQNRWAKLQLKDFGSFTQEDRTYYVRDAQGNTIATYYNGSDTKNEFIWQSQYLFGSSRLGSVDVGRYVTEANTGDPLITAQPRRYELTNHLGNVPITFGETTTDYTATDGTTYLAPEILSHQDYTAFGLEWHRSPSLAGNQRYRYGFNGKEQDADQEWGDFAHYDYGFRIYNPAIARFLSVDPLSPEYPMLTPYQFASNRPIDGIDLDGLEFSSVITSKGKKIRAVFKVINNSNVVSDIDAKKYLLALKTQFANSFTARNSRGELFYGELILDFVSNNEVNRETDYFLELVDYDRHTTVRGRKTSDRSAEIGVSFELGKLKETTKMIKDSPDAMPIFETESYVEWSFYPVDVLSFSRTGSHEIGHVGGLEHPWYIFDLLQIGKQPKKGDLALGLHGAMIRALEDIKLGRENESKAAELIMNNLMNSQGNPAEELKSNEGDKLTINQVIKVYNKGVKKEEDK